MRNFLLRYRYILALNLVGVLLVLVGWWWTHASLRDINQPLIIHFSDYVGINYVGGLKDVSVMAYTSLVAILVNTCLALALESRDWFLGKFMTFVNLLLGTLIFIGFAAIIAVNR